MIHNSDPFWVFSLFSKPAMPDTDCTESEFREFACKLTAWNVRCQVVNMMVQLGRLSVEEAKAYAEKVADEDLMLFHGALIAKLAMSDDPLSTKDFTLIPATPYGD